MDEGTAKAHAFTVELCRGNREAEQFCTLWFLYCHGIDDLLDSRQDGRPTMDSEAILQLFITAAVLYSCPFYVAYRSQLFPLVIMVTNLYADSVAWERSGLKRRRIMADVLRTCGDEMLLMVAMIVGGWQHVRSLSPRIREIDWILQHDENDNPN